MPYARGMERAELQRIVAANDWVWEKWWPALRALSPEQAGRAVGGSFPSVYATTLHLVAAEWAWLERLLGRSPEAWPGPDWAPDLARLEARWREVAGQRRAYFEQAEPLARVAYRPFTGSPSESRVWEIAVHFTTHTHFHRGQLAGQFRLLGLEPPSAHPIAFFRL